MNIKHYYPLSRGGWRTTDWQFQANQWASISFIDEKEFAGLQKVLNRVQDKMPTISPKTNLLIDKSSEVPRAKFKEFVNDNKCKKVTLLSKADVVFVRRETVKFLLNLEQIELLDVPKAEFDAVVKHSYTSSNLSVYLKSTSSNDNEYNILKAKCTPVKGRQFQGYRNAKTVESIDFLISLINSKATLVYDDCLTKTMNQDGIDLDEEIYETLKGMLLSKDDDTFKLGIEMLSNVNLEEENIFKISLLMNQVYTGSYRFNAMSRYSTKNFKSLLNYLALNKIRWNQPWETYGMSMWNRFGKTEHASYIKKFLIDNLNKRFTQASRGETIEIVDIILQ